MELSGEIKRRALALYKGLVQPASGMEKHFVRVCKGEARAASPEERAWLDFVNKYTHTAHQREARRIEIEGEAIGRLTDANERSRATIAELNASIDHLESVIHKQQKLIQSLLQQIEQQNKQIDQSQRATSADDGAWEICSNCGGGRRNQKWVLQVRRNWLAIEKIMKTDLSLAAAAGAFFIWMSLVGNPHVIETAIGLVIATGVGFFVFSKLSKR